MKALLQEGAFALLLAIGVLLGDRDGSESSFRDQFVRQRCPVYKQDRRTEREAKNQHSADERHVNMEEPEAAD